MKANLLLAIVLIVFTLTIFAVVILKQLGGNEALFLIIGHMAAWAQIIIIYYFRKKPPA